MLSFLIALSIVFNKVDPPLPNIKYVHIGTADICKKVTNKVDLILDSEIEMPTAEKKGDCVPVETGKTIDLSKYMFRSGENEIIVVILSNDLSFEAISTRFESLKVKGKVPTITSTFNLIAESVRFENININLKGKVSYITIKKTNIVQANSFSIDNDLSIEFDEQVSNYVITEKLTVNQYNLIGIGNDISVSITPNSQLSNKIFYAENIKVSFTNYDGVPSLVFSYT